MVKSAVKSKLSFKEARELEGLPQAIEALENEQASINAALADGSLFRDDLSRAKSLQLRLAELALLMENTLLRWEQLESRQ